MKLTISVEVLRISHVDWWNNGANISRFSLYYFYLAIVIVEYNCVITHFCDETQGKGSESKIQFMSFMYRHLSLTFVAAIHKR